VPGTSEHDAPPVSDAAGAARLPSRVLDALEPLGGALVVTDTLDRVVWVNAAFAALTGWGPAAVRGRVPTTLSVGPEAAAAVQDGVRGAVAARAPYAIEALHYARDGRQYWVRVEGQPTFAADGTFTGYVALHTETTGQRLAEASAALTTSVGDRLLACASAEAGAAIVAEVRPP